MLKKIFYYLAIVSLILFVFFTIEFLPIIFASSYKGIIFLVMTMIFILFMLYLSLKENSKFKNIISINIIIICLTIYLAIMYIKTLNIRWLFDRHIQVVNIDYFSNNFMIMAMIMLLLILNIKLLMNGKRKQ